MESVRDRERDLAYTEFVQSQWAALYRTAFLLTGDHQRAEDVVQTALMKLYLAWPRVASMSHPAAYARTVVVNQLTSWWRLRSNSERPTPNRTDQALPAFDEGLVVARTLWTQVLGLPPRQRAVIVLRYYEDRSEAEIAEILGISAGSVKTHAHHAMATLRDRLGEGASRAGARRTGGPDVNLDDLLTRSARDIASDLAVPPAPDPQALGAHAVSLRRRRRMGGAAVATVAALVGVAILVPAMSARLSSEEPVDEPPPDRLGNVPAWADAEGKLHIGDDVIEVGTEGVRFALTARGVVWTGTETPPHLFWQSLDGEPVELTSEATQLFTTDPLGDLVVWVTLDGQMVTYDVAEQRVVDSRPVLGPRRARGGGRTGPCARRGRRRGRLRSRRGGLDAGHPRRDGRRGCPG